MTGEAAIDEHRDLVAEIITIIVNGDDLSFASRHNSSGCWILLASSAGSVEVSLAVARALHALLEREWGAADLQALALGGVIAIAEGRAA